MTEYEKMISQMPYNPTDNELVKMRSFARKKCKEFNNCDIEDSEKRVSILKELFGQTGKNIYV